MNGGGMLSEAMAQSGKGRIPGEAGIWIIVLVDLAIFSALFISFTWFRTGPSGQVMGALSDFDKQVGFVNTIILLISSWVVVVALAAAREGKRVFASRLFVGAMACGVAFTTIKCVEYSKKFDQGITIETDQFYSYYFVLTGLHLAHLIVGIGVLWWMRGWVLQLSQESDIAGLECGAIYWHMVDLIWMVLFPLIYLVSAAS